MKKYRRLIIVILSVFLLIGCSNNSNEDGQLIKSPDNNNLTISGSWNVDDYRVLDKNLFNSENLNIIMSNDIIIENTALKVGSKVYTDVRYKLKVVDSTYNIPYESEYTIKDLKLDSEKVEVISIIYQNSILGEFIKATPEQGYLYYQGILLNIEKKSNSSEKKIEYSEANEAQIIDEGRAVKSEGLYLGIKTASRTNSDGEYIRESYRTLWISTKNNELQDIKEMDNIIFPRLKGIWTLEPNVINSTEKNIYYEYFTAKPIDSAQENKVEFLMESNPVEVYRSIKFIGNDYISTEKIENDKGIYSKSYQILPVDSMNTNKGLLISDLYTKEINKTYESIYQQVYNSLSEEEKEKLSKYISYSNIALARHNGKWILEGRISALGNEEPHDFITSIKPNKNLINYDTLIIPWNTLKGRLPSIVDAFTSPEGTLAIIVMENEILVYPINNGVLGDDPIRSIPLREGESIIMAEWCSGDYVDKWGAVFKENSRIIE